LFSLGLAQAQVKVQMSIRAEDRMAAEVRQELGQPARPLGKVKVADDVDQSASRIDRLTS